MWGSRHALLINVNLWLIPYVGKTRVKSYLYTKFHRGVVFTPARHIVWKVAPSDHSLKLCHCFCLSIYYQTAFFQVNTLAVLVLKCHICHFVAEPHVLLVYLVATTTKNSWYYNIYFFYGRITNTHLNLEAKLGEYHVFLKSKSNYFLTY